MKKPINIGKPKGFDYFRKITGLSLRKRTPVVPKGINFSVPVNPLSFRRVDRKKKGLLEEAIKKKLEKVPDGQILKTLYNKKIYLKLEFYCRPEKIGLIDIDNMTKPIADILQKCGVFRNDSQIMCIDCCKVGISKKSKGSISITIGELAGLRYQYPE